MEIINKSIDNLSISEIDTLIDQLEEGAQSFLKIDDKVKYYKTCDLLEKLIDFRTNKTHGININNL